MAYKDPERQRAYAREWLRRNTERARQAVRRWSKSHPEQRRAAKRAYYARHREQHKAVMAAYVKAHPEVARAKSNAYRARVRAAAGQFTSAEWRALVAQYRGRCAYCGVVGRLEVDHRVPLSRGGTNSIDNVLPACGSCNRAKHRLTEAEFRQRRNIDGDLPRRADRMEVSGGDAAG